jgi:anti-sigma regulatory factor (Ser/Thr protein kinase)
VTGATSGTSGQKGSSTHKLALPAGDVEILRKGAGPLKKGPIVCRVASASLSPQRQASTIARRFLTETLLSWGVLPDGVDRALLLTSEAVTNAVVHARTASTLTVALSGGCLEVGVRDLASSRLTRRLPRTDGLGQRPAETVDPLAEGGRGMLLIAAVAQRWGVQDLPVGKQVWFQLQVQYTPESAQQCIAHRPEDCRDTVHALVLEAGRAVGGGERV